MRYMSPERYAEVQAHRAEQEKTIRSTLFTKLGQLPGHTVQMVDNQIVFDGVPVYLGFRPWGDKGDLAMFIGSHGGHADARTTKNGFPYNKAVELIERHVFYTKERERSEAEKKTKVERALAFLKANGYADDAGKYMRTFYSFQHGFNARLTAHGTVEMGFDFSKYDNDPDNAGFHKLLEILPLLIASGGTGRIEVKLNFEPESLDGFHQLAQKLRPPKKG